MNEPRLTPKAEREIQEGFSNNQEAHDLLALIDAEFRTDPMSVQCFDLRIVERVRACVAKQQELKKKYPFYL